jgi:hypothetical protein
VITSTVATMMVNTSVLLPRYLLSGWISGIDSWKSSFGLIKTAPVGSSPHPDLLLWYTPPEKFTSR